MVVAQTQGPIDQAASKFGLALRPEQDSDAEFLDALYATTRWEEFGLVDWPEGPKRAFLKQQRHAQSQHYARAYAGTSDFRIIEANDSPIGRLYLSRTSSDLRIVDITLMPAWRRKGLGGALLAAVIVEAGTTGRSASIHVEEQNPARRLYERLGFRVDQTTTPAPPYVLMRWVPSTSV